MVRTTPKCQNSPDRNTPHGVVVGSVVGQCFIVGDGHDEHDADENGSEGHPQKLPQFSGVEAEHVRDIRHPLVDSWNVTRSRCFINKLFFRLDAT